MSDTQLSKLTLVDLHFAIRAVQGNIINLNSGKKWRPSVSACVHLSMILFSMK